MRMRRAFTLIELITVMAISAILLTIIVIPVVQGFNLTRAAQGFSEAQNRARLLIEQITREIGNSAGVRDNSGIKGTQAVVLPGQDGTPVELLLEAVKLDIVKPSQGDPVRGPSGAFQNPDIGKEDPTLRAPKGQITLPVAGGSTLIRYFIGLRRPLLTNGTRAGRYNNPYDGLLMARNGAADNLYVLYRAEAQMFIYDRAAERFRVNTELFTDADGDGQPDDLDDPYFFTLRPGTDFNPADSTLTNAGMAKALRMQAWMRRSTIVTEVSRYDMVQAVFDRNSRQVRYDGNVPRAYGLIAFRPERVSSEPAKGLASSRAGEESPNAQKLGPDQYVTKFGGWTSLTIRTWPSVLSATLPWTIFGPWQAGAPYLITRRRLGANGPVGLSIYAYPGTGDETSSGTELFDVSEYIAAKSADPADPLPPGKPLFAYPFSHALEQANGRSAWLGDDQLRAMFIATVPDARSGRLNASFSITEVGNGQQLPPGQDNRPALLGGNAFNPNNDPDLTGVWSDPKYAPSSPTSSINHRFNKLWRDWDTLAPALERSRYVRRFVDLRVARNADGSLSPLHPTEGFIRARIVPGSEEVVGPDQNPGPNYGRYVRYSRVATRPVGRNQYYINYVQQREPDWAGLGFGVPPNIYDPAYYDPMSFVSSILQPPYKPGYLELNSAFGEPIPDSYTDSGGKQVPTGTVFVSYRFQFTEPNDVVAVDYDSRQVMTLNLTIRNFPQTSMPNPQGITVRGAATVRNFLR